MSRIGEGQRRAHKHLMGSRDRNGGERARGASGDGVAEARRTRG
jgi:hypothetical protein